MVLNVSGTTQNYLNSLDYIQRQMSQAQTEVSSGFRVQQASDDPAAIATIFSTQNQIALNQQAQSNLNGAQSELSAADTALQTAITTIQSAMTIAAQAATFTTNAPDLSTIAQGVAGLQQQLLSLSQTQANGKYIFSGDQDTQAQYQLSAGAPEGVLQNFTTTATRTIADANGAPIAIAQTAQQIFDPQSGGAPAQGNAFAAINSLLVALQTGNTAGISAAATALSNASDFLNGQLAFYGQAQNQVTSALTLSQKFQIQEKSDLGNVQNVDLAAAALQLSQTSTEQQASLSVAAKIEQMQTVFSYLG
jgi:flagellar hook-associated protein 3 FlgL